MRLRLFRFKGVGFTKRTFNFKNYIPRKGSQGYEVGANQIIKDDCQTRGQSFYFITANQSENLA